MKVGKKFGNWGQIDNTRADIVTIGDYCVLGAGSTILTHCPIKMYKNNVKINIGNYVYIGAGCYVLPGVTIGDNVMIGAGSVVSNDIPSNSIAGGNPCRVIRKLENKELLRFQKLSEQGAVGNGIEPDYTK